MENRKNLYTITLKGSSEYAFENFNLMNKFTSSLERGSYYFKKVPTIITKPDSKNFYIVSTDEEDFAFDDSKLMRKFISPFDGGKFYCRMVSVIKSEEELQNLLNQSQPT